MDGYTEIEDTGKVSKRRLFWFTTGGIALGGFFTVAVLAISTLLLVCVCMAASIVFAAQGTGYLGPDDWYPTTGGGPMEIGESVATRLAEGEAHDWTFEGTQGQRVTIKADGDGYADPDIRLIGPDGDLIARNDDSSYATTDAAISAVLPENGVYTIRVIMSSGGLYALSVED